VPHSGQTADDHAHWEPERANQSLFIHAAATSLLDDAQTWLGAVRPGLALYRGAVRVTTKLLEVRQATRPIGYGGVPAKRVGVVLVGYANGLRPAPVMINGRRQEILEVGMNSAFVSVDETDGVGEEVVLLGDGLSEAVLGERLAARGQEVLCRYCELGSRRYEGEKQVPS
jgi:alanine racemase